MADKLEKIDVSYGPGDIDGEHCGACRHFVEPEACALVRGRIRSGGWCKLWKAKRRSADEGEDDGVSEAAG